MDSTWPTEGYRTAIGMHKTEINTSGKNKKCDSRCSVWCSEELIAISNTELRDNIWRCFEKLAKAGINWSWPLVIVLWIEVLTALSSYHWRTHDNCCSVSRNEALLSNLEGNIATNVLLPRSRKDLSWFCKVKYWALCPILWDIYDGRCYVWQTLSLSCVK